MADFEKALAKCLRWEGGYTDRLNDGYECTNMGVTIATYQRMYGNDKTCEDLRRMTREQMRHIYKSFYWDRIWGDNIEDQSIAELMYDWSVGSGVMSAVRYMQRALGFRGGDVDGKMGRKTLGAINGYPDKRELFGMYWRMRESFFRRICERDPGKRRFLKGWMNRLKTFVYQ